jgi:predicted phosphodiesterase
MAHNTKGESKYKVYEQQALELLRQNDFNAMQTAIHLKEHSQLTESVESIRHWVKKVVKAEREKYETIKHIHTMPKQVVNPIPNKFNLPDPKFSVTLPESYAEQRNDYVLPLANNNILVISDIHAPYQDNQALTLALEYGYDQKVNTIVINGDLIDFQKISRFTPSPKSVDTQTELDIAKNVLRCIRDVSPYAKIVWLEGNHDRRYQDYVWAKAEQLAGDPHYLLSTRLDLDNMRIEFVDQCRKLKAGKLSIMHGHMIMRGAFTPVSPALGVYRKQKCNTMIGHVHQASEHTEGDGNGDITTCWSTGCLTTLHPEYDPFNTKHGQGFALVHTKPNGIFEVHNKRIYNNKIL